MALIIKLKRPFARVKINADITGDFGRHGNNAVEVPEALADALEGYRIPAYRKVIVPSDMLTSLASDVPPPNYVPLPLPPIPPAPVVKDITLSAPKPKIVRRPRGKK